MSNLQSIENRDFFGSNIIINENILLKEAAFSGFLFLQATLTTTEQFLLPKPFMKKQFVAGVFVFLIVAGCSKSSDSNNSPSAGNVSCTGTKSYSADVSPIIQSICANAGCHNAGSTNGVGPLTNYQQVFNARTSIRSAVSSGEMPLNTTLTAAQKSAIICWIDNGASNN